MPPKIPPRVRGQIEYFTSPYEQKLFGDMFDAKYMMAKLRRNLDFLKDAAPAAIIFATIVTWGPAKHERLAKEHRY